MDLFRPNLCSGFRLQASGMGLFYIRVNVKALVTGSITKWSPNSTSWHNQYQDMSTQSGSRSVHYTILCDASPRTSQQVPWECCMCRASNMRVHACGAFRLQASGFRLQASLRLQLQGLFYILQICTCEDCLVKYFFSSLSHV
jgi:hypothetical protein